MAKSKSRSRKWWHLKPLSQRIKLNIWRVMAAAMTIYALFMIVPTLVTMVRTLIEIRALNVEKSEYLQSIRQDSLLIEQLRHDEHLERYAREHYFMQRENEYIYIVK